MRKRKSPSHARPRLACCPGGRHFTLRMQPGLIEDGLFARTRNPNYFGELLIYSGFALSAANSPLWCEQSDPAAPSAE